MDAPTYLINPPHILKKNGKKISLVPLRIFPSTLPWPGTTCIVAALNTPVTGEHHESITWGEVIKWHPINSNAA